MERCFIFRRRVNGKEEINGCTMSAQFEDGE